MKDNNTQAFSAEAIKAACDLLPQLGDFGQYNAQKRLELLYNLFMQAERNLVLSEMNSNKANGFYTRCLGTPSGSLSLEVPRDRQGEFRPQILPARFARDTEERQRLLEALFCASYSPSQTKQILRSLGMHYSEDEMDTLRTEFLGEFDIWMSRELPRDSMAIYIDAYHTDLKEGPKVSKSCLYSVVGLDWSGMKDLFGMYISKGSESKGFWLQVFNDLIKRGLKRVLIVVSDNFPGIIEAVSALFPQAYHQLCIVHLQRNITRNMARQDAKLFNQEIENIKNAKDFDSGMKSFDALLKSFTNKYPSYIEKLKDWKTYHLSFLRLPPDVRKYFNTTNAVESLNSGFEKIRVRMGGFFQSENALKINVFIMYTKLKFRWSKGMALIKGYMYDLRQLFAQVYGEQPSC